MYGRDIALAEVDDQTITEFARYLDGHQISERSRAVYNRILRQALFAVNENGELTADMLVRRHSDNIDYLDTDELLAMMQTPMPSVRLAKVRDTFLFMCFSGLTHDDVLALRPRHLTPTEDGQTGLRIDNRETGTRAVVPLLRVAQLILESNSGMHGQGLMPPTNGKTVNAYIKEVGTLCGIQKHMTLCVARNTFAATIAGENLVAPPVIAWLLAARIHSASIPTVPLEAGQMMREIRKTDRKLAWMNKHLILFRYDPKQTKKQAATPKGSGRPGEAGNHGAGPPAAAPMPARRNNHLVN